MSDLVHCVGYFNKNCFDFSPFYFFKKMALLLFSIFCQNAHILKGYRVPLLNLFIQKSKEAILILLLC